MMDGTTIAENEHGLVRLFHYIPDPENPDTGDLSAFVREINVGSVNENHIQRVVVKDLGDMTLSAFFGQAYGIEQDKLAPVIGQLDALDGTVFILRSSAVSQRPATFNISGAAKLVATLPEPGVDVRFAPLPDDSAKRNFADAPETPPARKKPSDAAMSGRIATVALVVMGFLVWLMIKVAG